MYRIDHLEHQEKHSFSNAFTVLQESKSKHTTLLTIGELQYIFFTQEKMSENVLNNGLYIGLATTEKIAVFDLKSGQLSLFLSLGFPFTYFDDIENGFLIVHEVALFAINSSDCSIRRFLVLPDIIENVIVVDNLFHVFCLSGKYIL